MTRKKDERFWWAVLVRATEQERTEVNRDKDAWHRAFRVGARARHELVRLGLDLDMVFPPADEEFLRLYAAEEAKDVEEARRDAELDRIFARADELLMKHGDSRREAKMNEGTVRDRWEARLSTARQAKEKEAEGASDAWFDRAVLNLRTNADMVADRFIEVGEFLPGEIPADKGCYYPTRGELKGGAQRLFDYCKEQGLFLFVGGDFRMSGSYAAPFEAYVKLDGPEPTPFSAPGEAYDEGTAFALLTLDTSGPAVRVTGAGIFSERYPTMLGKEDVVEVYRTRARTYTEAYDAVYQRVADMHPWIVPLLAENKAYEGES